MKKITMTSMRPIRSMLVATAISFVAATASAQVGEMPANVTIGGGAPSNTLSNVATFLADQLTNNRNLKNVSDSRIAVASFVNLNKIDETDTLGMALAENLMHEMHIRGFGVVDFKTMQELRVRPQGDFVFSRDLGDIKPQHNIHYFLSGTITRNSDGAVINARLIQSDTSLIVSTAQSYIPRNNLARILGEDSRGMVERVIVEHPTVPPVRRNIVSVR